jgi:hypothetical protein
MVRLSTIAGKGRKHRMKYEMNSTTWKFASLIHIVTRLIPAITLALVVAVAASCERGADWRTLSSDEVQVLFSGKTVKGYHEKRKYSFTSYYEPTGIFRSYQGEAKEPRLGKWWVNSSGDICIHWEGESQDLCRKMMTDDDGHYWKVLVKRSGKQILIVSFESFVDGNMYDL